MTQMPKTSEAAAEWVAIDELTPWKDNPRKNDGEPVRKVAESIKRFGFASPIIARRANGEIIAGHTRWKAAKELGLDRVPVRFLDLDPVDAHLLAVADNRIAEEAQWDADVLRAVLADLKQQDAQLVATGFTDSELHRMLSEKGENDPTAEWVGMPECESEALIDQIKLTVHFPSEEKRQQFAQLVGQTLTPATRSIRFPPQPSVNGASMSYDLADDALIANDLDEHEHGAP